MCKKIEIIKNDKNDYVEHTLQNKSELHFIQSNKIAY